MVGGGNLNLNEVQEPVSMLTACCASHTSVASISRTCQSASRRLIGQTAIPSSSVGPRIVQCACVRATENLELALVCVCV